MEGEPTSLTLIIRLAATTGQQTAADEREIKVLQRTRVSHLLKTISPAFGGCVEKDFDAYLLRGDMDVTLDSACRLSDYQCKNQDVIELRRKEQLMTIAVNIYADEVREYQVNASLPVYEIVKYLGQMLGVENTKELSLALPSNSEKTGVSVSYLNWLDVTRSLNSQGIEDGDMLLLRKKFFIFNEDIREAEGNDLLNKLIYHQLQTELVHAKAEKKRKQSSMSLGLSAGSDSDESSEELLVGSPGYFAAASVTQAFGPSEKGEGDSTSSDSSPNNRRDSSNLLQRTLTKHQSQYTANFTVTLSDESESAYLCFQSSSVILSKDSQISNDTIVLKKWSVQELTSWERIENGLKLRFKDEWHTVFSSQCLQIADYISHMKSVMEETETSAHVPYQINIDEGENSASSTPMSSPMKTRVQNHEDSPLHAKTATAKTPSITLSMLSTQSSESIESVHEEAGIGEVTEAFPEEQPEASGVSSPQVLSPSHKPKRERTTNVTPPSYFGMGYKELVEQYMLVHINVLDQEIRQILVNCTDPVRMIIRDICATFDIQYPESHYLRVPRTVEELIKSYGGKPKVTSRGFFQKEETDGKRPNAILKDDVPLIDQIDLELKPYVFVLKRRGQDEVDAVERYALDTGEEWPDGEDPGVARYRLFYQSWIGVVQGDYPIDKKTAVNLAGLLTYIYHGNRSSAPFWPPYDFNARYFLPEKYHGMFGIENDVLKSHRESEKISLNQAIDAVVELCKNLPASCGLYFEIKVPVSGTLRKKMESRVFGLKREGLICFGKGLKQVCLSQRYADISDWAIASSSFHLKFNDDDVDDLYAYSYQARQIMELMQTYVKTQYKTLQEKKERAPTITDV